METGREQLLAELVTILRTVVKVSARDLTADTNLTHVGMTSVDQIRLVVALERRFGIEIEQEEAMRLVTIGDVLEFLQSKQATLPGLATS